jgi:glycerophosphoryl diester phosphodiesterase
MIRRARVAVAAAGAALVLGAAPLAALDLQGHRGARGLAPENTMAGFAKTMAIGVTTLETDLAVTKDDAVVISHDPDLNPALTRGPNGLWLDGRGPAIRSLTLEELKRYDVGRVRPDSDYGRQWPLQWPADGERIPTLADFLARTTAASPAIRYAIETKVTPAGAVPTADPETFVRLTLEELKRANAVARTSLLSFDWRTLAIAKKLAPDLATTCITAEYPNFDTTKVDASGASPWHAGLKPADHGNSLPRLVKAAGCTTWSANFQSMTRARLDEARALGLQVAVWTVNQPADMERMIDLGVDGLITDYPDRARAILARRGIAIEGVK